MPRVRENKYRCIIPVSMTRVHSAICWFGSPWITNSVVFVPLDVLRQFPVCTSSPPELSNSIAVDNLMVASSDKNQGICALDQVAGHGLL